MSVSAKLLNHKIQGRIVCMLDTLRNQKHSPSTRRSLSSIIGGTYKSNEYSCSSSLTSRMNGFPSVGEVQQSSMCHHRLAHYLHKPQCEQEEVIQDDPNALIDDQLKNLFSEIKESLGSVNEVQRISKYHFEGHGKAIRPVIIFLMSQAINAHLHNDSRISSAQRQVAKVAEMIHTAALFHDDVVDKAETRRGRPSVNFLHGPKKAVLAGDYVVAVSMKMFSQLLNVEVNIAFTQILFDIVDGEFMQLETIEDDEERFPHYLKKTFNKTASVFAHSCKAAAIISGGDESIQKAAFEYGSNVGIGFQLVDDLLDYAADYSQLGKPIANDLKGGMATAPVLFASEEFPELKPMILRRFKEPGDVEKAIEYVHKSRGIQRTRALAREYCMEAVNSIISWKPSNDQQALIRIANKVIDSMGQDTSYKGEMGDVNGFQRSKSIN